MIGIPYTLATAGHIDHGKSALVRALTGIEPDRLPEERARGMTIELGFAHFRLAGGPCPSSLPLRQVGRQGPPAKQQSELDIGVIDVPGHEDFIKNMVAGVGSIDAALLVVAADDGWMPQTEEHLQILMHLGVSRGIVAMTKSDLSSDIPAAVAAVREQVRGTFLEASPIVPTSTLTNRGIAELKTALAQMFATAQPQRDLGKPRLAVDRAFTLKGVGTVVTGTLTGGPLSTGQRLVVQPAGTPTHIRMIHTHGKQVDVGTPGSRVALNLPELSVAADRGRRVAGDVARGDVVTVALLGDATRALDVSLEQLGRGEPRPMRSNARVWLHHGSGATAARLRLLRAGGSELSLARLKLVSPIFALAGDQFVLRDWSEQRTLAGGMILDVDPRPIRRDGLQIALLERRASNPTDALAFARSTIHRDRAVERSKLLVRTRFAAADVEGAIQHLIDTGEAVDQAGMLYAAGIWAQLTQAAATAIDAYHSAYPERAGMPITDLHRSLRRPWLAAGAEDAVIEALCRAGFARRGPAIARIDHRPALPARLAAAGERIRSALRERPFDPPSRNQLARDDAGQQALKFLIAAGEALEIGPDMIFATDAYTRAAELVRAHISQHGPATVSQLKSVLNSSRRVMVPLVERLDRDGITRRHGDLRVLRPG